MQEGEVVDEEEISRKPKRKAREQSEERNPRVVYTIPDTLEDPDTQVIMAKARSRLTLTDLEDGDQTTWLLVRAALTIAPFNLATEDAFPERGDTSLDSFCSGLFSLAHVEVSKDATKLASEIDSNDGSGSDSDGSSDYEGSKDKKRIDPRKQLASQLDARKASYSDKAMFKYRIEVNKLASVVH